MRTKSITKKLEKINYYEILKERLTASLVNVRDGRASDYLCGLGGDPSYKAEIDKLVAFLIDEVSILNRELFEND